MSKILFVAPHPDDEVLGCGGTIFKAIAEGNEVFLCYVTYGDASCPEFTQEEFTARRIEETRRAISKTGLPEENIFFLPAMYANDQKGIYPPSLELGGFYPLRLNERLLAHYLMKVFRIVQPSRVYLPHEGETHPDHRIVATQGKTAVRFSPGKWFREYQEKVVPFKIEEALCYEVDTPLQTFDVETEVSMFWEAKLEMLRAHNTQSVEYFIKRIEARGRGKKEVFKSLV